MRKYIYSPAVEKMVMPAGTSISVWRRFFERLMEVDYYAPLYAVVAFFEILFNAGKVMPPSPFRSLYYDIGIEMAEDNGSPAYEAAADAGFLSRGLCQVIEAAYGKDEYYECYLNIAAVIIDKELEYHQLISEDTYQRACALVSSEDREKDAEKIELPTSDDVREWIRYFEETRMADSCASASILSYYLEDINEHNCRVFCPLDYEEYRVVGEMMRNHTTVLHAAMWSGLLAEAIPTYVGAALDNVVNWECLVRGIRYLLDSELSGLVPLKKRVIAEKLMQQFGVGDIAECDEDAWNAACGKLHDKWETDCMRGY